MLAGTAFRCISHYADFFNDGFAFGFFGKTYHIGMSGLTYVHGSTGRGTQQHVKTPRPAWWSAYRYFDQVLVDTLACDE